MNTRKLSIFAISVTALFVIVWLFVATQADDTFEPTTSKSSSADEMPRFQIGDWQLGIATDPDVPKVGDNALKLKLFDEEGKPASGANIEAYAEMPAMGSMPAMRAPTGRLQESAPGHYEGAMNLSMRGEWPLTVQIHDHPELGNRRLQFDLATDRAGLSIASGGTPVGNSMMPFDSNETTFSIDSRRRQLIGLETQAVTHHDLVKSIRAVGRVTYDERLLSQVTLKYDGFIGDLYANYVGAEVEQGQVLFTVYSPELLAAQQQYLETIKRRGGRTNDNSLLHAARQRLALWDMTEGEIEALVKRGKASDYVPIHSPQRGTVIERNVTDGSGARAGHTLLTIADLSTVWVEAEVYEADLPLIEPGTKATITLPYLPGRSYEVQVEYIYPYLDATTRTGRIRLTIDNSEGELKPEMYAEATLEIDLGHRLAIPEEAVIVAGQSRVVFLDLGGGQLSPVKVTTGRRAQGLIEIRDGLTMGDVVVTSGNFLVAAEARLKTGMQQW